VVPERDDLGFDRTGTVAHDTDAGGAGDGGLVEGGRLPTPHLFYASQDPRTGAQLRYKAEFREGEALSPEKLAVVKNGLWAVVNEPGGTAYGSRIEGLEMGGKTGTVQVVGREATARAGADLKKLQDHAWFAGFAPVVKPSLVVVVFVENGGHGNLAAEPLAKKLFEARFGIAARPRPGIEAALAPREAGVRRAAHRQTP
jgi:penicillin-binding protein 2